MRSCNKHHQHFWLKFHCPFFDETHSTSIKYNNTEKSITYGSGGVTGKVVSEYLQVYGSYNMSTYMPIILKREYRAIRYLYDGILGLSPKDESAGPLFIDYLKDSETIDKKQFAILPPNVESTTEYIKEKQKQSKMTFGGY